MSQFYALMPDNTIKHISLKEEIVDEVKNKFIAGGRALKPDGIEEDLFNGDITSRRGENITYVYYNLPEDFIRIPDNQADISVYNIAEDIPKSIFWYDNGIYYFQVFNKKNLLQRKTVLQLEVGNKFTKMSQSAFVIEDKIHAIYEAGKLYFQSYTSANQIFSLIDFVTEATDVEIDEFGKTEGINVNVEHIKSIANVKTRRLVKSLSKTENIKLFMQKSPRSRTTLLKKYGVNVQLDENKKLLLPTNNVAELNRILEFLNEDIFRGVITDNLYRSNSKKKDN